MQESSYKVPGGKLVKIKLQTSADTIGAVKILGDFFLHPEETILKIEESLIGIGAQERVIEERISQTLKEFDATLVGVTAADIAKTILMAWNQ
ncbi:MAG: lipoate protein ligase C-terminal domain-containing protein [Candidatus Thorarchaeota archaeon]